MKHTAEAILTAGDAVWVATAMLHREHPRTAGFTVSEIVNRVEGEHLSSLAATTIYQHANQHCVANRPPNRARLRMLIEMEDGKRRLFHQGDHFHPLRANAPTLPDASRLPEKLRTLMEWYKKWDAAHAPSWDETDPLMKLIGSGKHIWVDEHADEYIRRLRTEGWG